MMLLPWDISGGHRIAQVSHKRIMTVMLSQIFRVSSLSRVNYPHIRRSLHCFFFDISSLLILDKSVGSFLEALRRIKGCVRIFAAEIRLLFPSIPEWAIKWWAWPLYIKKGDMLATLMAYGSAPVHSGWHNCKSATAREVMGIWDINNSNTQSLTTIPRS
jgi:hypothetical protein